MAILVHHEAYIMPTRSANTGVDQGLAGKAKSSGCDRKRISRDDAPRGGISE